MGWLYAALNTNLRSTVHSSTLLQLIVMVVTILYCTVLYCTVLYCTVLYCTETGAVSDLLYKYIKSTVSIQYSRQDPKITDDFTEQYSDSSFTESKNIVRTSVRSFVLIYSSKTEKKQLKNIFYISLCMI